MAITDVLELPYEKRKFLYVVQNEQAKNDLELQIASIKVEQKKLKKTMVSKGAQIGLSTAIGIATGPVGAIGTTLVRGAAIASGAKAGVKAMNNKKKLEQFESTYIATRMEVLSILFPGDGLPENNTFYICNPKDTKRYYQIDNFYEQMFIHKREEAINLLRALGATEINIISKEETNKNTDTNFSVGGVFSGNGRFTKNNKTNFSYSATYEPSNEPPYIPEEMHCYHGESKWKFIANQRLNNGMKSFNLEVTVSEDFGIEADLEALIKALKISVKGNFKKFSEKTEVLIGRFS